MKLLLTSLFLVSSLCSFAGKIDNLENQYRVKCKLEKEGFGYGSSTDFPVNVSGNVNKYRCDSKKIGCGHFVVKVKRKYQTKRDSYGNVISSKIKKEDLKWPKGQIAKAQEVGECFLSDILKDSSKD
ncbi:hypothetical protein N9N67_04765 [Bacteriovoracaceae bacterium]|nr:hypothetical protein [Bacteriovoracaceae bacterium]